MTTTNDHEPGEPTRYVFVELPRCPVCNSTELKIIRTEREAGEKRHRMACKADDCGHRFFVIYE